MKTAISIPDPLFDAAEKLSSRLGMSRSRFYCRALEEFLKTHGALGLKDALDAVYGSEDSRLDPAFQAAQLASIAKEEW